jgi:hypothetical protein
MDSYSYSIPDVGKDRTVGSRTVGFRFSNILGPTANEVRPDNMSVKFLILALP